MDKGNYQKLLDSPLISILIPLLSYSQPSVRSKSCNLIGNLFRHDGTFYQPLDKIGVVPKLSQVCTDQDSATRKFACFAVGNAGFHDDSLYQSLSHSIPGLVSCLEDQDPKTCANAAGALGNLARHSDQLSKEMIESGAVAKLVGIAQMGWKHGMKIKLIYDLNNVELDDNEEIEEENNRRKQILGKNRSDENEQKSKQVKENQLREALNERIQSLSLSIIPLFTHRLLLPVNSTNQSQISISDKNSKSINKQVEDEQEEQLATISIRRIALFSLANIASHQKCRDYLDILQIKKLVIQLRKDEDQKIKGYLSRFIQKHGGNFNEKSNRQSKDIGEGDKLSFQYFDQSQSNINASSGQLQAVGSKSGPVSSQSIRQIQQSPIKSNSQSLPFTPKQKKDSSSIQNTPSFGQQYNTPSSQSIYGRQSPGPGLHTPPRSASGSQLGFAQPATTFSPQVGVGSNIMSNGHTPVQSRLNSHSLPTSTPTSHSNAIHQNNNSRSQSPSSSRQNIPRPSQTQSPYLQGPRAFGLYGGIGNANQVGSGQNRLRNPITSNSNTNIVGGGVNNGENFLNAIYHDPLSNIGNVNNSSNSYSQSDSQTPTPLTQQASSTSTSTSTTPKSQRIINSGSKEDERTPNQSTNSLSSNRRGNIISANIIGTGIHKNSSGRISPSPIQGTIMGRSPSTDRGYIKTSTGTHLTSTGTNSLRSGSPHSSRPGTASILTPRTETQPRSGSAQGRQGSGKIGARTKR
ncbi:MAG: putative Serine-threonine protein kinase FUSED [Streblomastix strix]|uniref:non-specific serine/threonine protein kinase n=1 Tax=Streblomastix strix TaxID=222440 RepID=A0A5J4W5A9_9EUKA|nr:MAG: putative Serine-threonine protein kinase FUSED [Streblomastix strix]